MHNMLSEMLKFMHFYCVVYFTTSLVLFIMMAILNLNILKRMSTYRLILLYSILPYLWFKNLFKKHDDNGKGKSNVKS